MIVFFAILVIICQYTACAAPHYGGYGYGHGRGFGYGNYGLGYGSFYRPYGGYGYGGYYGPRIGMPFGFGISPFGIIG